MTTRVDQLDTPQLLLDLDGIDWFARHRLVIGVVDGTTGRRYDPDTGRK